MRCMPKTCINCIHFKKRLIALLLLLCFFIVSLSATIFIIAQANHNCIGDGCPICAQLHNAHKLLEQAGKTTIIMSAVAVGLFTAFTTRKGLHFFRLYSPTLVSVKTRLNN
jgi:hypothetical protein